ncbi:DUF4159 domain-containing protein [Verrucomicrobiota bacterium]
MTDEQNKEINDILSNYADGQLAEGENQKLAEIIRKSPEAKQRLAWLTVIERLLRISWSRPVSVKKIMGALPETGQKTTVKLHKSRKKAVVHKKKNGHSQTKYKKRKALNQSEPSYQSHSPAWVFITLAILMLLAGGLWWKIGIRKKESNSEIPSTTKVIDDEKEKSDPIKVKLLTFIENTPKSDKNDKGSLREISPGKLYIVQVIYDGEWKTHQAALPVLLQTFNKKTDIAVKLNIKEIKLTDSGIFNSPLLYITGHEDFLLNEKEVKQLRKYLNNGGFLFAESCCGRSGFDNAFRKQIERVLKGKKLRVIPTSSDVFSVPNKIRKAGVTLALSSKIGSILLEPQLEGIKIGDNYAVIYSKYGMAGGWQDSHKPDAEGYNTVSALQLGQNILMYAITH